MKSVVQTCSTEDGVLECPGVRFTAPSQQGVSVLAWWNLGGSGHLCGPARAHVHPAAASRGQQYAVCVQFASQISKSPRIYKERKWVYQDYLNFFSLGVNTGLNNCKHRPFTLSWTLAHLKYWNEYTTRSCHHRQEVTLIKYCESWKVFTAWIFAKKKNYNNLYSS